MSVRGSIPQARACSACARPISPPSAVTAALLLMFCGLNGRTATPRRAVGAGQPRHQERLAGIRAGALDHQRSGHARLHGRALAPDQAYRRESDYGPVMFAMVLDAPGRPLRPARLPDPVPGPGQVLVRVRACAVCRTDLHVVDGELPHPKLPLIPGHEIVGEVVACGPGPAPFALGRRVGIPWLGHTCGACPYCRARPRESVRRAGLHRLHAGRRLCRVRRRRRRLLLPAPRPLRRRRGRSAAVRRPDRLSHLAHGRRRPPPRHLGLRRRRPHRGPGRPARGPRALRLHPPRRHGSPGLRPHDGCRLGRRRRHGPADRARRRPDLRPGRQPRPHGTRRCPQGRDASSAAAST